MQTGACLKINVEPKIPAIFLIGVPLLWIPLQFAGNYVSDRDSDLTMGGICVWFPYKAQKGVEWVKMVGRVASACLFELCLEKHALVNLLQVCVASLKNWRLTQRYGVWLGGLSLRNAKLDACGKQKETNHRGCLGACLLKFGIPL